jgi:formylglycine-generating enzyme required for sulfatase activity
MAAVAGGTFEPTPFYQGAKKKPMTVVSFCLDATEVTVEAYNACVASKKCKEPDTGYTNEVFCNWGHPKGRAKHPINCVAFDEAKNYCVANGKRLPFAEEWEWAARGGIQATKYPWGNAEPNPTLLNACAGECVPNYAAKTGYAISPMFLGADPFPETAPVASFPVGNSGLYDMAGNVAELTIRLDNQNELESWGGGYFAHDPAEVAATGHLTGSGDQRDRGFRCALVPELQ